MAVTERGIEDYLGTLLKVVLNEALITNVDASDDSRANEVVLGKPTTERRQPKVVSIWIHHPLSLSKDMDEDVDGRRSSGDPNWWPSEMGADRYGMERIIGAIQINIREQLEYSDALQIISSLKRRTVKALDTDARLKVNLTDDFDFTMIKFETFQAAGVDSGGQRTSIHNEWVSWRAYVSKPKCA